MAKLQLLHGPNLNLLGKREPSLYGATTLDEINILMMQRALQQQHELLHYQSNAEHELVDIIQQAPNNNIEFILINAAAFTHTSIAIRDAFKAVDIPFIEIHLSNIYARETFRHSSYLSDIAVGVISGFGDQSYELALLAAINHLAKH
ncbi:MAG: type II 3-dehydroquinate dehydratase [Thiohalomonadales bacterium]